MVHPVNSLLVVTQLGVFREGLVSEVFLLRDPLGIYPIETPHLPPPFSAYDSLQILGTKPINQGVCCLVTRR